jgi:hypothetical protein
VGDRRDFLAGVVALGAGVAVLVTYVVVVANPLSHTAPSSGRYDVPCHDQRGMPLKANDVIAAFRPEGSTMFSLPKSMYCNNEVGQVADVSNRRSVTADDAAVARDGWITCGVYPGGTRAAREAALSYKLDLPPDSPIFSGTKSHFSVANVSCALYPSGNKARQTAQVLRAMRRLDRVRARRTLA